MREAFRLVLEEDYELLEAPTGRRPSTVHRAHVDLVLLDLRLPGMDGIEVLERIKALDENVEVVLVTAVQTVRAAVAAMKLGALDYVTKPFDEDEILPLIRRALERRALDREVVYLRSELAREHDFDQLVGQHPLMQQLYQLISAVARNPLTVLIRGRAGPGRSSSRGRSTGRARGATSRSSPVNVAAIPERSSSRSCSATRRAPSRAPSRGSSGSSSWRTGAPCSWTRSRPSGSTSRPSSCGCSRSGRSSGWAGPGASRSTCG